MSDNNVSEMISKSLESIRTIADSGTVIGDPIPTNNGTVILPVSKISVGFASGGLDYLPKSGENKEGKAIKAGAPCFGGGGGTGVSVTPICFLVIAADGSVTMMNVNNPAAVPPAVGAIESVTSFAEKAPDIIAGIKALFAKKEPKNDLDDEKLSEEIAEMTAEMEEKAEGKAEKAAKKAEKKAAKKK